MHSSKGRKKRKGGKAGLSKNVRRSCNQKKNSKIINGEHEDPSSTGNACDATVDSPLKISASSKSTCVPEIEIKLESSDEEDSKSRRVPQGSKAVRSLAPKEAGKTKSGTASQNGTSVENHSNTDVEEIPLHNLVRQQKRNPVGLNAFGIPAKPLSTKGRKSISDVWKFFYAEPENVNVAICCLCGANISRGRLGVNLTTTSLRRHLDCKHPLEWAQREMFKQAWGDEELEVDVEAEVEMEEGGEKGEREEECEPDFHSASLATTCDQATAEGYSSDSSVEEEAEKGNTDSLNPVPLHESQGENMRKPRRTTRGRSRGAWAHKLKRKTSKVENSCPGISELESSDAGTSVVPENPLILPGTKSRKATSAVWQFFYIDRANICRAICTLCEASVSRGKQGGHFGTSALMRHLESRHSQEWTKGRIDISKTANEAEAEENATLEEEAAQVDEELPEDVSPPSPVVLSSVESQCVDTQSTSPTESQNPALAREGVEEPRSPRRKRKHDDSGATVLPAKSKPVVLEEEDCNGKYTPNHPRAQAWNRSIAELLCGMALPYSFISASPFHKFMASADPRYRMPSRKFFSRKAVPQLHEAVCERITHELNLSEGFCVHITAHMWTCDPLVDYMAITAHWVVFTADSDHTCTRRHAVLCVKNFQKDTAEGCLQQALAEQIATWLTPHSLSHGFLLTGGGLNAASAIQAVDYTYIPCFAHCLNMLVTDFLQNNHQVTSMLEEARKICHHFYHSAKARQVLEEFQQQNNQPRHPLKQETAPHWNSTYYMLERLLEQQKAVHEYISKQQIGTSEVVMTSAYWNLISTVVTLLQPFEMATREMCANNASLSQVLPEVRYLQIFLNHIRGHFENLGDASAIILVDSLSHKLSSDCRINEMFNREEYVLATLLDPRFKGRIEAILPLGSDIDHWKQITVKKVKEIMLASVAPPDLSDPSASFSSNNLTVSGQTVKESFSDSELELTEGNASESDKGVVCSAGSGRKSSVAPPLIQKEKTLIEHLEIFGLLASQDSGASLSTESHTASIMVEKYLQDNKTVAAREDPLAYWEKRRWLWPALTKLAILYLSCPPSSVFSEHLFGTAEGLVTKQKSTLEVEGVEHLLFLKSNLASFPDYTPPPLIFCSENELERSDSGEE